MGDPSVRVRRDQVIALAAEQHGVVTRAQLLSLGMHPQAIKHRLASGRLHPVSRGIYAEGSSRLTREGVWMAAVLSCGPCAVLSHETAAELWRVRTTPSRKVTVSVPAGVRRARPGIRVVRRKSVLEGSTQRAGVPVTGIVATLSDLATVLPTGSLDAAINEADKLGLIDPERLRAAVEVSGSRPGAARLRTLLARQAFVLTESELERRFLPLARRAGLTKPQTGCRVSGFEVDFFWPDLGLVVETDGLRYHRTPAQQSRDRLRDQAHAAAGLTPLRFTYAQVAFEPGYVVATLARVAARTIR